MPLSIISNDIPPRLWVALVRIGWFGHAFVALSAFLSLIPISPGSYQRGLIVALAMAMPLLIYGVVIAAVTAMTWARHTKSERLRLLSVLFLIPVSYGVFALISWGLFPNG